MATKWTKVKFVSIQPESRKSTWFIVKYKLFRGRKVYRMFVKKSDIFINDRTKVVKVKMAGFSFGMIGTF